MPFLPFSEETAFSPKRAKTAFCFAKHTKLISIMVSCFSSYTIFYIFWNTCYCNYTTSGTSLLCYKLYKILTFAFHFILMQLSPARWCWDSQRPFPFSTCSQAWRGGRGGGQAFKIHCLTCLA